MTRLPIGTAKIILKDSPRVIQTKIVRAIANKLGTFFIQAEKPIKQSLDVLFGDSIRETSTYKSLTHGVAQPGNLKAELGVNRAEARLEAIVDTWVSGIAVKATQVKAINGINLKGNIVIGMVESTYADVLSLASSFIHTNKGVDLQWLKWLLTEGDKTIIRGYTVQVGNFSGKPSRTGLAVMVKAGGGLTEQTSLTSAPLHSWGVPKEFVGFPNNNFVTRMLDMLEQPILNIISSTLKKSKVR